MEFTNKLLFTSVYREFCGCDHYYLVCFRNIVYHYNTIIHKCIRNHNYIDAYDS